MMTATTQGDPLDEITGAAVTVRRTVAWHETDAAGHNHFTAAFRWMEEAEHRLYRALGIGPSMVDIIPRVHIEIDYRDRLFFGEEIEVTLGVVSVGRTSCRFAMQVRTERGEAISSRHVIVHAASTTEGSAPWPDDVRAALESGARFRADLVGPDPELTGR